MENGSLPPVLTLEQAASYLQFTTEELRVELADGRIPGRQIAGQWRISRSALDDFLNSLGVSETAPKESVVNSPSNNNSTNAPEQSVSNPTSNEDNSTPAIVDNIHQPPQSIAESDVGESENANGLQSDVSQINPSMQASEAIEIVSFNKKEQFGYAKFSEKVSIFEFQPERNFCYLLFPRDIINSTQYITKKGVIHLTDIHLISRRDMDNNVIFFGNYTQKNNGNYSEESNIARANVFIFNVINNTGQAKLPSGETITFQAQHLVQSNRTPLPGDTIEFKFQRTKSGSIQVSDITVVTEPKSPTISNSKLLVQSSIPQVKPPFQVASITNGTTGQISRGIPSLQSNSFSLSGEKSEDANNLLQRAQEAFAHNDLQEAEKLYRKAILDNPSNINANLYLAHTLLRLSEPGKAEAALLKALNHVDNVKIYDTLGQVYMKQSRHRDAIAMYNKVIDRSKSDSQKVGAYQFIGQAYMTLGSYDDANKHLISALELAPTNKHTRDLLDKLKQLRSSAKGKVVEDIDNADRRELPDDEEVTAWGDDEDNVWEVRRPGISDMLEADASRHPWSDPIIIARGGIAYLGDATRLLQEGLAARKDFGPKAMMFLEASKAFGVLDELHRDPNQHQEALQRYASQQGGRYLLQLIGEIKQQKNTTNSLRKRWLRDSACAYYVEAMKILQYRRSEFMLSILRYYLQTLLIYELGQNEAEKMFGALENAWQLDEMLEHASRHSNKRLLETVAKGIIELGRADRRLIREVYAKIGPIIRQYKYQWRQVFIKLGGSENASRFPDIMRSIISTWRNADRAAIVRFSHVYNSPISLYNIADAGDHLQELLKFQGVFSDSDKDLLHDIIDNVLGLLTRYGELPSSSVAERDLFADKIKQNIQQLRKRIDSYPTYWGRVNLDALLQRWEQLLEEAEKLRIAEIRPNMVVRLESKRLPSHETTYDLVFSLSNNGQATALNPSFELLPEPDIYICEETRMDLNSVAPRSSVTIRSRIRLLMGFDEFKFLTVRYKLEYQTADKSRECLPINEDTVHFGEFKPITENPFDESPPVYNPRMFKGRDELIDWLTNKLRSEERKRSTLLYGLTRTGKTSILIQLQRRIAFTPIHISRSNSPYYLLPLRLSFDKCARSTVDDFYAAIFRFICDELLDLALAYPDQEPTLWIDTTSLPRNIDGLEDIIHKLRDHLFYPVFLIDEFTIYRQLVENKVLDATILSRFRHFSLDEQIASFIYAGTYDLKALTSDPAYGIIGQFVATDEQQVGRISDEAARELVTIIEDELYFSDTAIEEILFLSGNFPYFIQMICKNCVIYANQYQTPSITPVELIEVVRRLVSRQDQLDRTSMITPISAGAFAANVWSRSDSALTTAVLAALSFHSLAGKRDVYLSLEQIEGKFRAAQLSHKLVATLSELSNKQVLEVRHTMTGTAEYRISVDLFRRWFTANHSLEWAMGRLQEEGIDN